MTNRRRAAQGSWGRPLARAAATTFVGSSRDRRARVRRVPQVPARALLIDFGGVLTSDVFAAFSAFCEREGLPAQAMRDAFRSDEESRRLLVEHETGRLGEAAFGLAFARRLTALTGVGVSGEGLIERATAALEPDHAMVEAVAALHAGGVPTVLVSNTLGDGAYEWCDLDAMFDAVVLSGRVGVRKPSREIYRMAVAHTGVAPEECVLVDDLPHNLAGAERLGIRTLLHRRASETIPLLDALFPGRIAAVAGPRTRAASARSPARRGARAAQ
jgi:putative hydrolase of the HAD superfamily